MTHANAGTESASEPKIPATQNWRHKLAKYREASDGRAITELLITLVPYLACWVFAAWLISISVWLIPLAVVPAAAFLIRLFIIQHDCGHGSMFSSRKANDWVGRFIGLLTVTPYDFWKYSHAFHHATHGNLDKRGIGDVPTLTVEEYNEKNWYGRLLYRAVRHPLVLFGFGPVYIFLLQQRLPIGGVKGRNNWLSTLSTNAGMAAIAAPGIYFMGWWQFLLVGTLIIALTSSIGVWLFYVQHQFEDTQWSRTEDWNHQSYALHGSSYYKLPGVLNWMSGNIGVHHVHHMSSAIPFYRLPQVLKDHPELKNISRITLWQSFKFARLKLWCEAQQKLVTFREARVLRRARVAA